MIKMTIEGMMCQHDAAGADDNALREAVEKQGYTVKAIEHA